ncbi:hypothetical protein MGMO_184c00030 [Methyloglobulus morosus KoM1]|uniref:Uncharacterized protein n=1 Tax=Methyloglobulus morosus KoM1 TaxID=1116472 RepID=V5BKE6_9GAMM|nr:hypothetical protein [Methyloglobulus morosus]ESS66582.1 hypothetical protein MGMO_184c00030 [Methyloglobulus morosus KoM1]
MAKEIDLQKVFSILDGKAAEIERFDDNMIMETVGVAMALDALRESLDKVETHLNIREFEKASYVGYQEVAHNFVYVQRTLAGLQTVAHQKEAFICNIAHEASVAYEDVAPCVEQKMQSSVKKSAP